MVFSKDKLAEVIDALKGNKKVTITSHSNPDGDALGSLLGMYFILGKLGVEAKLVLPNGFPDYLEWLPGANQVLLYSKNKDEVGALVRNSDILFALDYNSPSRLEELETDFRACSGQKVMIDHHPNPESAFDIQFSKIEVSSTAELVYEFANNLSNSSLLTYESAVSLFTGIMTDTGSFSYACSFPRTFEIVAKLIEQGVKVDEVQQLVYNNFSENRLRLVGHSLASKMKVFPEHRAAYISLTRAELNSFGYVLGDTEGIVNLPLSIKGMVLSALFTENTNHIKVSLRSRGNFPANRICEQAFNGGGHLNAAGGKSFTTMEQTQKIFEEIIEKYKEELNK